MFYSQRWKTSLNSFSREKFTWKFSMLYLFGKFIIDRLILWVLLCCFVSLNFSLPWKCPSAVPLQEGHFNLAAMYILDERFTVWGIEHEFLFQHLLLEINKKKIRYSIKLRLWDWACLSQVSNLSFPRM